MQKFVKKKKKNSNIHNKMEKLAIFVVYRNFELNYKIIKKWRLRDVGNGGEAYFYIY